MAAGLLRLLAFCAPEAVPLGLLLRSRPGLAEQLPAEVAPVLAPLLDDELAVKDAVAALRRYSLIRPAPDGAVSVHRLVQAVTADQMPEDLRRGLAASRRRLGRGRPPRRSAAAGNLAGVRGAASRTPRRPCPPTVAQRRASRPIWGTAAGMRLPANPPGDC